MYKRRIIKNLRTDLVHDNGSNNIPAKIDTHFNVGTVNSNKFGGFFEKLIIDDIDQLEKISPPIINNTKLGSPSVVSRTKKIFNIKKSKIKNYESQYSNSWTEIVSNLDSPSIISKKHRVNKVLKKIPLKLIDSPKAAVNNDFSCIGFKTARGGSVQITEKGIRIAEVLKNEIFGDFNIQSKNI